MARYNAGCEHVHVTINAEPIDNHECHCNVCKTVTGQHTTHVAFFNHADVKVDHPEKIKRVPFNKDIFNSFLGPKYQHPNFKKPWTDYISRK